ncbi:anaphase promoting complex subunit 10, putative [Plasmodium relictum]|uniref:Anaphase promoting complex subunit 10, putative n=1 Tax=Plasmodium relictum TaxID=85471 RepID=A0A1J1HB01_PLARL|nr:anaphase promoting complex subunit 10, putative [Plasmodium relictum]CRH02604.1 anaphase promoting complex subunit 10, putative [Plasmodium relictum]
MTHINKEYEKNIIKNKYELKDYCELCFEKEYEDEDNEEDDDNDNDNDNDAADDDEDWCEQEKDKDDDNYNYNDIEENCKNTEDEVEFSVYNSDYKNEIKREYNNTFLLSISELNAYTNEISSICIKDKKIIKETNKLPKINLDKKYIEIGCLGFWKLSSCKSKFDIKNLKDNNVNTYWQSASLAPHTITIQFIKLTKISKIYLLFNYLLDESYTPYEISIKIGNDENHLEFLYNTFCDINKYSLNKPFWFIIDIKNIPLLSYLYNYNTKIFKNRNYIYCRCLQIVILSSQHNGKDTRIRQIKIFGPNYFLYKYDKMLI